jgi:hypothetical protein
MMGEKVTLVLPDDVARQARAAAAELHRPLEEVLVDWIGRAAGEPPVESLPDARILALCDAEMDGAQQAELSDLLDSQREGRLTAQDNERLEALLDVYRRGLVRKAQAWKTAVQRGLKPALQAS